MFLYSNQTKGFYLKSHHGDGVPADAVEVSNRLRMSLLDGLSQGKSIIMDESGTPALADSPQQGMDILAELKRSDIEIARKDAEREGVAVNGIRYAGDPGNRQAIMEVLDLVTATGQESIASWKDSDGRFHADHPVPDVREALMAIATRRGELISREGKLNALIDTALEAEDREALEAIEWSFPE